MRYLIILITLTNCSTGIDDYSEQQVYKTYWHLTNVRGVITGVNNDFGLGKIFWLFNEEDNELSVYNINTTNIENGLNAGTYHIFCNRN